LRSKNKHLHTFSIFAKEESLKSRKLKGSGAEPQLEHLCNLRNWPYVNDNK